MDERKKIIKKMKALEIKYDKNPKAVLKRKRIMKRYESLERRLEDMG